MQKNTNKTFLLIALVAILAIGGIMAFGKIPGGASRPPAAEPDAVMTEQAPAADANTTATPAAAPAEPKAEPKAASSLSYDNASLPTDPLGERTLGNPLAPIKIEEFSSLTCPHCGHFHKETFAALKEKYIDTGKVFFIFTDFPLNAAALDASMIARCMPPERYFTFIAFLYESQEQWAFTKDYQQNLRQDAKLAGMDDARYDACLADTKLKEGIVTRMQDKSGKYTIGSTPSFLINGKTVLTGALPIAAFDQAIEDASRSETTAPAPAPTPAPSTEQP
jgi:protein-disulfide isomerase